MTTQQENKDILNEVVNALLDENTPVLVETTYHKSIGGMTTVIPSPQIPTKYGKVQRVGGLSLNAYYARSVKIGKFSITKNRYGTGFLIRTPDNKESKYISTDQYNIDAYAIWAAALSKYDKNIKNMLFFLEKAGYKNLATHKTPKASMYDQAINQLKSLGLSEQNMTHMKKLKDKSTDR